MSCRSQTISAYQTTRTVLCETSGSRREVDENCALLGHYAASSGNFKKPV